MVAFFTIRDAKYVPQDLAISRWAPTHLGGLAICGLLARQLENHSPGTNFVPARLTVDMFRPVATEPVSVSSQLRRAGNRITIADAWVVQSDDVRARATVAYLAQSSEPLGDVWHAYHYLPIPVPTKVPPGGSALLFKCGQRDWTADVTANQNAERKSIWLNLPPLVEGEPISRFQRAAILGDLTNLICNWGSHGVGYINTDMTLALARLPEGAELGLHAQDQLTADGIATGTATLYDRKGACGTCLVTAISNARRQVDFTSS